MTNIKLAKLLFDRGHSDLAREIVAKTKSIYLQISDIADQKERQHAKEMFRKGFKYILLNPKPVYKKTLDEFSNFSSDEFFDVQELTENLQISSKLRVDALKDRVKLLKIGEQLNTYTKPNFKITKIADDEVKWEGDSKHGKGIVLELVDAMEKSGIRFAQ